MERPGRVETSDGSRVRVDEPGKEPTWLGLAASLERQAEVELCLGSWAANPTPWQVRAGTADIKELRRGWTHPLARVELGPAGQLHATLPTGSAQIDFQPELAEAPPLMLTRQSGERMERWAFESIGPLRTQEEPEWLGLASEPLSPWGIPRPPVEVELEASLKGYLIVRPVVDGRDLGPFLFDTAASVSCIDRSVAVDLDWEDLGPVPVQGVGGPGSGRWLRTGTIALRSMQRSGQPIVEFDLAGLEAFRDQQIAGLLGADWLRGNVVVVDHRRHRIVFHDPQSPSVANLPWQPMLLESGAPCAELSCAPYGKGWFRLDTGSNDTITVQSPSLREALYPVRADFLELPKMRLGGIGGVAGARRGELPWIELGSHRLTEVPASFVTDTAGPLASPYLVGTLGCGLLRHQPYAIDMDNQRIAFLPVTSPGVSGLAGDGTGS